MVFFVKPRLVVSGNDLEKSFFKHCYHDSIAFTESFYNKYSCNFLDT